MKLFKIGFLLLTTILLNSCASKYTAVNPNAQLYNSSDMEDGVSLSYKYDLLGKKYAKKETKKGIKIVAIKITNNSERDIVFGQDVKLTYENGNEIYIMDTETVFKSLKQNTAIYLLYLLLSPTNLYSTETTNGYQVEQKVIFPIGLIIGPGLAGINMITASSANKKFKTELLDYNLNGVVIKKGETKAGLIGIKSDNYNAIRVRVE